MTPENATDPHPGPPDLTPENADLLAGYAAHLGHSPLAGYTLRTYLGAVRAYLRWLQQAQANRDPLNDAAARDWAVRDYRSYLVTVAKKGHRHREQGPGRAGRLLHLARPRPALGRQAPPGPAAHRQQVTGLLASLRQWTAALTGSGQPHSGAQDPSRPGEQ